MMMMTMVIKICYCTMRNQANVTVRIEYAIKYKLSSFLMSGTDGLTSSNLALNRPASQSSAFTYATTLTVPLEASFAVDGIPTSTPVPDKYSCSSTDDGGSNWLMVDLGRLVSITFVVLTGTVPYYKMHRIHNT